VLPPSEAADVADSMPRCACLPFCFWRGTRSRRTESRGADEAAPGKRHRRRMRRRFWLSWLAFAWLWLRRSGRKHDAGAKTTTGKQRRGGQRRLLLLNKTSLLASVVVSGDSCGLLPATVRYSLLLVPRAYVLAMAPRT
jgi:hypothetical protein